MSSRERLRSVLAACAACLLLAVGAGAAERAPDEVIGSLETQFAPLNEDTLWWKSVPFGSFSADAIRTQTGADVALLENRDIRGSLANWDIRRSDIEASYAENVVLAKAVLRSEQLLAVLENAVSAVSADAERASIVSDRDELGGLLQVSGLEYSYDPSAARGQRIYAMEPDSEAESFLVTAPLSVLEAAGIADAELLSESIPELVEAYIRGQNGSEADYAKERFRAIGIVEGSIVRRFPRWLVVAVPLLTAAAVLLGKRSLKKLNPFARITEEKNKCIR